MTVVEIKKEKQHLMAVFLSDGTNVLLDKEICASFCIKVGSSFTVESLKEVKEQSDYFRAKSRALWYLDRAAHTEKALYNKLLKAGFGGKISAKVIARFKELGLVDDRRFAENFAYKCKNANISKRAAVSKMLEKGVPLEVAKEVLSETEIDESEQITDLINKKYKTKLQSENGTQKVYAALIRRGFSFGAVKEALKKYCEELEFSEE